MKKLQQLVFVIVILAAFSFASFAADFANFKFIGFSADGKYLAFEEWNGFNGHRADEYATTYFIDVAKNVYLGKPEYFNWVEGVMKKSLRISLNVLYKKRVNARLKRLNIERGNTGKLVVAHLPGDHSFRKPLDVITEFYDDKGNATEKLMPFYTGSYLAENYDDSKIIFSLEQYSDHNYEEQFDELKLEQIPSGQTCSLDATYQIELPKLQLTLKSDINHRDLKPQILQKDERISPSRACGNSYQIEQIYFYEGNIAVFLRFQQRGIEGYDRRYMAITGKIKFKGNY
jgi:predicted secreted protein